VLDVGGTLYREILDEYGAQRGAAMQATKIVVFCVCLGIVEENGWLEIGAGCKRLSPFPDVADL